MASRLGIVALLAIACIQSAGCCCAAKMPWPCGREFCGPECGPKWCHEWFSHKPPCCEACSACGQHFTGHTNGFVEGGIASPIHPGSGYGDGEYYGEDMHHSAPPHGEFIPTPDPLTSNEEFHNEFGQLVSYNAPVGPPRRSPAAEFNERSPAPPRNAPHGRAAESSFRR